MRRPTRAVTSAVVAAALVLVTASAAVAYWSATGSGRGAGAVGTSVAISLGAGSVSADLYPGAGFGVVAGATVSTVATNPNSADVRIVSLALDTTQGTGGFKISGDSPAGGCSATSLAFTTQTTGWTVAANATTTISLPNAVSMAAPWHALAAVAAITVYLSAGT
jgi:hypothetical protein